MDSIFTICVTEEAKRVLLEAVSPGAAFADVEVITSELFDEMQPNFHGLHG